MKIAEATKIKNIDNFCECLNISKGTYSKLKKQIDLFGINFGLEKIILHKKNGGVRKVFEIVSPERREFTKKVSDFLSRNYDFDECVQGFVSKRNIKTNAQKHLNKEIIINLDIKDFFGSIKIEDVFNMFRDTGFNKNHSIFLSNLLTVNGKLAQGFSSSPVISNIIFNKVDKKLREFAKQNRYKYTRYADDMTFSTNHVGCIKIKNIEKILQKFDFNLNLTKTKIQKKGGVQYVTGLTVCDDKFPRLPRYLKKNMRLEMYYMNKYGLIEHYKRRHNKNTYFNFLLGNTTFGFIKYIYGIEPDFAKYLEKQIESIISKGYVEEYLIFLEKSVLENFGEDLF